MPRPRLPKAARRVPLSCRVAPATAVIIHAVGHKLDCGQGEAIDHLADAHERLHAIVTTMFTSTWPSSCPPQWADQMREALGL